MEDEKTMYCRHCKNEVGQEAVACPGCGAPPNTGTSFCPQCAAETFEESVICIKCGVGFGDSAGSKKLVAGITAIFLGALGVHKFILGYTTQGVILLLVSVLSLGILAIVTGIIGLIEGIVYLTKSDHEFESVYVKGRRPWF